MSLPIEPEKADSLSLADTPAPYDLDRALVEAAKVIEFDWPKFLPAEGIKAGITEIAFRRRRRNGWRRRLNSS
jgi:hypothetical protein